MFAARRPSKPRLTARSHKNQCLVGCKVREMGGDLYRLPFVCHPERVRKNHGKHPCLRSMSLFNVILNDYDFSWPHFFPPGFTKGRFRFLVSRFACPLALVNLDQSPPAERLLVAHH